MVLRTALVLILTGCGSARGPEDPSDWFDSGDQLDVAEPVGFTDQPYDFPTNDADGIGALLDAAFPVAQWATVFPAGESWQASGCEQDESNELPFEIEGIVTIHPRYYYKTYGCDSGDEKFYGSYFVQDRTGGIFVLGDSKVAHFDMGDRVRLKVRAIRTHYDLNQVYAHDVLEVQRLGQDIYYEVPEGDFDLDDVGKVQRVSGTVSSNMSNFGEFQIETDDGTTYDIQLDVELNRRGVRWDVGERITVTGPVIYSFSTYSIVVMRVGQVEVHD